MVLLHLLHQETVRQHDEVHVPGLALAITQLAIAHAQLLLTIPMKGFRTGPTMPIATHDPTDFPLNPIRHQDDPWRRVLLLVPNDDNANLVLDVRDPQGAGEVPLRPLT